MARVPSDATAFAHREARYLFASIAIWLEASPADAAHRNWATALFEQVRHESTGVYVNFIGTESKERLHDAYPPATLARLQDVKRAYDPDNLFRFNQNITPAPPPSGF